MNTDLELGKTLETLRATLAQKRAARKAETNSHLRAFEWMSEEVAAESENPLLEQSFHPTSTLAQPHAAGVEHQHSLFGSSQLPKQDSQFTRPDAEESKTIAKMLSA